MVVKLMDHQMVNPNNNSKPTCNTTSTRPTSTTTKARPQEQLNCPRCNSTNTKFCYYNNYSLTQPRYLCKTCRRYWTEGGSLRNVPVGGGSRKNKKLSNISSTTKASSANNQSSTAATTTASKILPDLNPPFLFSNQHQNPKAQKHQDLNLAYPSMQEGQGQFGNFAQYLQMPKTETSNQPNPNFVPAFELLRTGICSAGSNTNFTPATAPESNTMYSSSGFPFQQDYKPNFGFSLDAYENRSSGVSAVQENVINGGGGGGRVLFPFGEMKQLIPTTIKELGDHQQNIKGQSNASNEFWNGSMLGGGGPSW